MSWEQVVSLKDLNKKQRVLFKKGPKQIVVFKVGQKILAINNRCPHQGYPLIEGSLEKSALTCHWHNWKFDLGTGKCVSGGDSVRTYNTKTENSSVWVELREPSKEEVLENVLASFKVAFTGKKYGRISREIAKLHYHGIDPLILLKNAILWSYSKLKEGTTHAYAAAPDWIKLYHESLQAEDKMVCIMEAIDHVASDALRLPDYPYPTESQKYSENAFIDAVESEDQDKACSLILGALEEGYYFKDLEKVLTRVALSHYYDLGHSLIYVYKTGELIRLLGNEVEKPLLLSLVRSLCLATREDLLPEFRKYHEYIEKYPKTPSFNDLALKANEVFRKSVNASMEWVVSQARNTTPFMIYQALLESNAKNLFYFDTKFETDAHLPLNQQIEWLDFTHGLTFANAVRIQCQKFPEFWGRGLLQLACFNGRNHSFLNVKRYKSLWVRSKNDFLMQICRNRVLDYGYSSSNLGAHMLKTYMAVKEELTHASPSCQKYLVRSVTRFGLSDKLAKHPRRAAFNALNLIGRDFSSSSS